MVRNISIALRNILSRIIDLLDILTNYSRPEILHPNDALAYRAIVRWGDGETTLALGKSTRFQRSDLRLARELRCILRSECNDIIVFFPLPLLGRRPFQNTSARYRSMWAMTALLMRVNINSRRCPTSDALMFRNDGFMDGRYPLFKLLKSTRRVLLVSSDSTHADFLINELGLDKLGASLEHIQVPEINAYQSRSDILNRIITSAPSDVVLLSAGPVGKCLVPDLLQLLPSNSKIIDTGNLFSHMAKDCILK